MQKTRVRFGISIASLIPWSLGIGAPLRVARWAERLGYDFLQVLPTWGVTGKENWPLPVKYHEGAWNPIIRSFPMGIIDALTHQTGGEGMPTGLQDLIGFPRASRCEIIERLLPGEKISHRPVAGGLYEVNPDVSMSPVEVAEFAYRDNCGLVLDTEHILQDSRGTDGYSPLGKTQEERLEAIHILAPFVQVVHLKSVTDKDSCRILRDLLRSDHREEIDFVAEYKPWKPLTTPPREVRARMKNFLWHMRNEVRHYS